MPLATGMSYSYQYESPSNGIPNVSIIVYKKKIDRDKQNKIKLLNFTKQIQLGSTLHNKIIKNKHGLSQHYSMPEILNKPKRKGKLSVRSSDTMTQCPFKSKFIVNLVSEYRVPKNPNPFNKSHRPTKWRVYRCQLNTKEETCCCSCNSDAMFEVMKSLYDCYKKKNCDRCNCILCGHLPREERRLGEMRKSGVAISTDAAKSAKMKMSKEKISKALEGKTPAEKEKILKDLALTGKAFPEPKSASESEIMKKVKTQMGLPAEAKTAAEKANLKKAEAAGAITPLEGKTPSQKEKILQQQVKMGVPLPEGRTPSEKLLIQKVKTQALKKASSVKVQADIMKQAKEEGLLTPMKGKSPEQKEKILRGLAMKGIPFPEAKTASEKDLADKVRRDVGLPLLPKTSTQRKKYKDALAAGLLVPLEGKSAAEKENILNKTAELGIPLPEGRTPSEKALIAKIKAKTISKVSVPSEKLKEAKKAGLLTPLKGKTPEQQEKILKGLAKMGLPLPEGKTDSEKKLITKVRTEMGLPQEPKSPSEKRAFSKAQAAGIITPLEGKSKAEKEKILKAQAEAGIPLPEGRTASEKALINKIKSETPASAARVASEKLKKAKAAGLLTPLPGKTPEQQEKILKGLAKSGVPLPEGKTDSEKKLIAKVRTEMGLPQEPKSPSEKRAFSKAQAAGIITPLEGKSKAEKEKILKAQAEAGIPLPEGRTASEKALINKIKSETPASAARVTSEKLKKAKAAGLLTPLAGKTPEQQEKILKGLAKAGVPLPEGKTDSEKKLIAKVRTEMGLPQEPKSPSEKRAFSRAQAAGIITPLEGKSKAEKEKILKAQAEAGLPLPEGRTASEKSLIAKIKATAQKPPKPSLTPKTPSAKLRDAKAAGLLTPLEGKTPEQKEKILKGQAMAGVPLADGKTAGDKKLIDKVRQDLGLPETPKSADQKNKYQRAQTAGLMIPLEGKSHAEKDKILRGQHELGIPLPKGRTPSERALIEKVKESAKLDKQTAKGIKEAKGPSDECICALLTPESEKIDKSKALAQVSSEKLRKAKAAGLITPLAGKTPEQKEKIIKALAERGLPLPEGQTPSEMMLISKIKSGLPPSATKVPSEKLKKAKAAGLLTPLTGKTPEQQEKILKGLAKAGVSLPEGKTDSEKKLIAKVRAEMGLPQEPKSPSEKRAFSKALAAGLITPLEGKTPAQKEQILKAQAEAGLPLPEGRTASEKALISKIKSAAPASAARVASEKLKKAKAAGLLTPLTGKTPEQQEKILKGLAKAGVPLPEGKTDSEKKLIAKVRTEMGLPQEPKSPSEKQAFSKAQAAGLITPLEGKTQAQKEKILKAQAEAGLPLPEGRTASEKALISKIKSAAPAAAARVPSEKLKKAKADGLLTPLAGKTQEQQEKILKGLAKIGLPLPEGKTDSQKKLVAKVRAEMGLPQEPKSPSEKRAFSKAQAAGIITPLEGKSKAEKEKILKAQAEAGLPLPEGRTASEKSLIAKIKATARKTPKPSLTPKTPSAKLRDAKAAGLLTPLEGKTPEQKEKILKGQAMAGVPLADGKTAEDKKLIDKVRQDLGLPETPKSAEQKDKYQRAQAAGLMIPLEGKSHAEKDKILRGQHELGIPLPKGRTPSERALIEKVKESAKLDKQTAKGMKEAKGPSDECICALLTPESEKIDKSKALAQVSSEKLRKAKAAGLITPLAGKTPEQKEKIIKALAERGLPLPEGQTPSEKMLISKIKSGLPPSATKVPSEKLKKAKAAGLLTPLTGKTPEQQEKILKGLAKAGVPLPEGKTDSEKELIAKVRAEMGLPQEPKSPSEKRAFSKALAAGLITPLEGKTPAQKEQILKAQAEAGLPLPEGRTASEKALISKIKSAAPASAARVASEKLKKAKAAGLLTPLTGKTPEQQEKILKGLAKAGVPLPEGKTDSEKKLIAKVRTEMGLPQEPKSPSEKQAFSKAQAAGLITPLEGKTQAQKEKILKAQAEAGLPLPEGRTASEKALINKIKATTPASAARVASEKLKKAKAAGLLTPLTGKTPEQQEKILKGLAKSGVPLPEGKTDSEKKLIAKVRTEMGLPQEPKSPSEKRAFSKAQAAGIITPLEGKSKAEKEKILKAQAEAGIPLPEGRTASEKALINKIKSETPASAARVASEKLKKAKAAGLLTPLAGKTPEQQEKILKGLAKAGVPLPEGKTDSEKKLIAKVRNEMGLPQEPKSPSEKRAFSKAQAAGIITPLEGKSKAEKEKIFKAQAEAGLPLPEGRTASEKSLIAKIKATARKTPKPSLTPKTPSAKLRDAKAAGLLTPLEGKTPEQKEKILKGQAMAGVPLADGKTAEDKKLIDKVRQDLGLPETPKSADQKDKYQRAQAAGLMIPLEGKSHAEKDKILRGQHELGIPLPKGRTPSERALIEKVKESAKLDKQTAKGVKEAKGPSDECICALLTPESEKVDKSEALAQVSSEKLRKAKAAGLITPLAGKTPEQKEKIIKALAEKGLPLPEGQTPSEKMLISKIKSGLPPSATKVPSEKLKKAKAAGLLTPLTGKTPEQQEKILKGLAKSGVPLPEGKTDSEKKLIAKVRTEMGLPQEPKSPSEKRAFSKAQAAGIITPLEGKSKAEKEKILKAQAEAGIPLPEGRTASEKALINKIKSETPASAARVASEKLKKAKAAGLLTPLTGKTPEQQEKILKGLAKSGVPLPEGKTDSEKKLIAKVRTEMGLPQEPKSPSEKRAFSKAQAAGIITPLEGKSKAEKEKILKAQAEAGIPLPEGRTASEKALINKIKSETPASAARVASEKLKKAKAAGLLTPLTGKTPEQQEKILKGLAKSGVPLPEGKTDSEKKLIAKVRTEMGLPQEPKSPSEKRAFSKAQAAGIITPLEGKSKAEKEKILKAQAEAGLPLPEGRTASEKALIAKIKSTTPQLTKPSLTPKTLSAKLRDAKAAGLLTPLEGKTPEQKEKILKAQAMAGIPLPEGKTAADKKLIDKVRQDLGLPETPKSADQKDKYQKAEVAGLIIPLEGKTLAEKEKILRGQHDLGISLPKGRTPSEKALIAKIKSSPRAPPSSKTKTVGTFTPLKGKSAAEKEKIVKGLAEAGLPLPEPKTASEKSLIQKIKTKYGIPPEAKTAEKLKAKTKSTKVGEGSIAKKVTVKGTSVPGITEEFEDIVKTTTCDRGCGCDKKKIRFKHSYVKIRVTSPDISSLCPCPNECLPGVKGGVFTDNEGIKVTVGSALGVPSFFSKENGNTVNISSKTASSLMNSSRTSVQMTHENEISEIHPKTLQLIHKRSSWCTNSEQSFATNESIHHYYKDGYVTNFNANKNNSEIIFQSKSSRYLITCSESYDVPVYNSVSFDNKRFREATFKSSYLSITIKTESSLDFSSEDTRRSSVEITSAMSFQFNQSSITSVSSHYLYYPQTSTTNKNSDESDYFTSTNYSADDITSEDEDFDYPLLYHTKSQLKRNFYNNEIVIFRMSQNNVHKNEHETTKKIRHRNCLSNSCITINALRNSDLLKVINEMMTEENFIDSSSILVIVPTSDEYDSSSSESNSMICLQLSKNYFKTEVIKIDSLSRQKSRPSGLKFTAKGKSSHRFSSLAKYQKKQLKDPKTKLQSKEYQSPQLKEPVDQMTKKNRDLYLHQEYEKLTSNEKEYKEDIQLKRNITEQINDYLKDKEWLPKREKINFNEQAPDVIIENTMDKRPQVNVFSDQTHFTISMDTCEDRPCCCMPDSGSSNNIRCSCNCQDSGADGNVASEIMTPMIVRQSTLLGLSNKPILNMTEVNNYSEVFLPNNLATRISQCDAPYFTDTTEIQPDNRNTQSHFQQDSLIPKGSTAQRSFRKPQPLLSSSKQPPFPYSCDLAPPDISTLSVPAPNLLTYDPLSHNYPAHNPLNHGSSPHCFPVYRPQGHFSEPPCFSISPSALNKTSTCDGGCNVCYEPSHNEKASNMSKCNRDNQQKQYAGAPMKSMEDSNRSILMIRGEVDCIACGKPDENFKRKDKHSNYCKCTGKWTKKCKCPKKSTKWKICDGCPECPCGRPITRDCFEHETTADFTQAPDCEVDDMPEYSSAPKLLQPCITGKDFSQQCEICTEKKAEQLKTNKEWSAFKTKDDTPYSTKSSKCKQKNTICGCPEPEPEPELTFSGFEIDEKAARQIQSELTQTTSGFNFKIKKKPPVEEEWTFDDAINYLESLQENREPCDCGKCKNKKKAVECECPYVPLPVNEPPPPPPEEELKGFKISVGGKGSASKGLAGVCCFDVLTDAIIMGPQHEREIKNTIFTVDP